MQRRFLSAAAAVMLSVSFTAPAFSFTNPISSNRIAAISADEPFVNKEAGIQFNLPSGWHAEPDGEVVTVSNGDNSFHAIFAAVPPEAVEAVGEGIAGEIDKFLDNIKITDKAHKVTFNGIPALQARGTGTVKGTDGEVFWTVNIILSKQPVFFLTYAIRGAAEHDVEAIGHFVNSIRPIH